MAHGVIRRLPYDEFRRVQKRSLPYEDQFILISDYQDLADSELGFTLRNLGRLGNLDQKRECHGMSYPSHIRMG